MYIDTEQKNSDEILTFVAFAYNTAKLKTAGFKTFCLLHELEAETILCNIFPLFPDDTDDHYITKVISRVEDSRHLR